MKHVVMSLFLALAVVGCGNSNEGGGDDGGKDAGPTDPHSQGGGLCSASNACPSGQFCFNGLCAIGCQSDSNCAADQYCDLEDMGTPVAFCKKKSVSTCSSDSQCASNQRCVEGLCSLRPPANPPSCNANTSDFNDGCDKYALCLDPDDSGAQQPYCASFPSCPQNGVCPTGQGGAVCNDGYIPNKGRFCMQGACKDNSNCPSQWSCVKPFTNAVLGFCSPGAMGFPCTENAQCASGQCMASAPGMMGMCM
ncbi:hypothetical protein JY651_07635 [Pyxidicoccus parkwayensis]|uniref:Dickkopf N-terminal cysteine-rich domain-containing protein n=1 Tax=Pyxidicoccus parkwayensis TaxID=2813578 RepID=A0ABX7P2V5_9BACT|nr:Dickkopf N-terminal cysteine-rich domain-containing protein [Pyxidicoccus parkwaysis]QSQ24804.1 hypothetical protein JY651_07635 [Pyxidicoccus parkwaysis]